MTVAPEVTTDVATRSESKGAVSRPRRSAVTARRVRRLWAKSAALVVAVAVMWLIVLAIITVV
jgi:hypothetical protein